MRAWVWIISIMLILGGCSVAGEPSPEPPTPGADGLGTEGAATTAPEPTLDLEAEVAAIVSADPTLCATELTAVLRIVEDQMGTLSDEDEVSALVTEACEDVPFTDQGSPPSDSMSEYPQFGESYTWTDGISVTISEPAEFTPSEYSFATEAEAYLRFTITITNGSGAEFDPSMALVSVQSGGRQAEEIFDSENGVGGFPEGLLLAGRDITYDVGFGVADPDDLVMEITPSFDHDPGIFVTE